MIGARIKETRKKLNLTQTELAEKAGVTRMTVVKLENGITADVSANTIVKIARALGTSTDYILCVEC